MNEALNTRRIHNDKHLLAVSLLSIETGRTFALHIAKLPRAWGGWLDPSLSMSLSAAFFFPFTGIDRLHGIVLLGQVEFTVVILSQVRSAPSYCTANTLMQHQTLDWWSAIHVLLSPCLLACCSSDALNLILTACDMRMQR